MVQALLAVLGSQMLRQPKWWRIIHLLFMPTVFLGLSWQLPSWLYLLALLLSGLVFWGTVKGDVPLFLSSTAVSDALIQLIKTEAASSFVDIGAGLATVVQPIAANRTDLRVVGLERAPIPWLIAKWRCRKLANVRISRNSFWDCDLGDFDVVFAFLSPLVMARVGEKIKAQMRPGSLFVSSSFPIPEARPESVMVLADRRKTRLYCYRIKNDR